AVKYIVSALALVNATAEAAAAQNPVLMAWFLPDYWPKSSLCCASSVNGETGFRLAIPYTSIGYTS
ncbi:MAG: hypothetical protein KJN99_13545, partial [Marinicaulis sp.]|nr:hypothetical protein [Marinicaulis sp.]